MEHREELHELLRSVLGSDEVYFQPPESVRMSYPAFVYHLDNLPASYADDDPYKVDERYTVTFISRSPVEATVKNLAFEHGFRFDRFYTVDNLNHYVFTCLYQ